MIWLFINIIYAYLVILFNNQAPNSVMLEFGRWFIQIMAGGIAIVILIKIVIGVLYKVWYDCCPGRRMWWRKRSIMKSKSRTEETSK